MTTHSFLNTFVECLDVPTPSFSGTICDTTDEMELENLKRIEKMSHDELEKAKMEILERFG